MCSDFFHHLHYLISMLCAATSAEREPSKMAESLTVSLSLSLAPIREALYASIWLWLVVI